MPHHPIIPTDQADPTRVASALDPRPGAGGAAASQSPPSPPHTPAALPLSDAELERERREVMTLKRRLRKVWVLIAGTVIIITGIIISPLPGPGFTLLGPIGLALIASEFIWARKLLKEVQTHAAVVQNHTDRLGKHASPLWIIPVIIAYWGGAYLLARSEIIPSWIVWAASFPLFTPVLLWGWAIYKFRNVERDGGGRVIEPPPPTNEP